MDFDLNLARSIVTVAAFVTFGNFGATIDPF